jgi:hypothetical protein
MMTKKRRLIPENNVIFIEFRRFVNEKLRIPVMANSDSVNGPPLLSINEGTHPLFKE